MAQQVSQNTFIRGLQMDTSPMQLDSATLSNALNATLVTMNGNEVILLNDMGNARVDNAYLPSGYVPIGMKEYGGVIYVAAYNPITNRGQLGSFPSPERRFGSEYEGLISGDINVRNFFKSGYYINKYFDPIKFDINEVEEAIETDTILVPLIKFYRNNNNDNNIENLNIIRAGDKFSIYDLDGIIWGEGGYKVYLSNFNNIDGNGEANLLKNNILTFSIGVLNSQNEFVDITPSLRRFNENGIIEENGSKTDMFNTGYFIGTASSKPEQGQGPDPENTRADKELIEERNKLAVNTYGQKLVGPLYLKMLLNVIKDFEYAIYGNKEEGENKYKLIIYSYYKYNFPDGHFRNKNMSGTQSWEGSRNALLNLGYINNCLEPGYNLGEERVKYGPYTYVQISDISKKRSLGIESIQYNTTSNLYSSSSKTEISFITEETEVPYTLLPGLLFGGMKNLKVEGVIDLSKLGSGLFELNNWRYYNSDGELTIIYGWESYPRYGEEISDIKFEFIDIYKNKIKSTLDPGIVDKTYYVENRESYNGVFNVTLGLEENNLLPNTLYLVKISHKSTYEGVPTQKYEYRFVLTTGLFNDCYFKSSSNFIKDYGKPKNLNGAIYPNHDLHTYVKGIVNNEEVNLKYVETDLGKIYTYNTIKYVELNEEEDLIVGLEFDLYDENGQHEGPVIFTKLIYDDYTGEALIYHNKLKIEFDFDINYTDYGNSSEETYGNLISRNAANLLKFGYIKKYNIDLALNYNLHEVNPDYYPLLIQGILPVTTGATFSPTTLVPAGNEAPPRPYFDTDGTGSSTNENHVINPVYRVDPSLDYSGGIGTGTSTGSGSSGSGSGGSGSSGSGNDNSEENTEESTPSNYVESEGESDDPNAIDAWLNLDLDKDIEQIQYKIGNKSISVDWKDFELDSNDDETYLTKSKITFYQDSGNISGYLNVYDKCIAGGESNGTVTVTNAFMSIYDHLKNIFSMYDGKLFGYVLWANNEKKSNKTIAIVENADVLENTYYSKNNDRTNHRRPASYYPGYPDLKEQNPPSYLMTFNSAESSDQDQYTKYDTNWYNNSGRNTSLSMSDKRFGIKKVQEMWDLKNTKYSIVGMMNADYLGTELEDWSEELKTLSKRSQFCRVWWKTTEDGIYALFPMMWRNIHLNVTYPTEDTDGQYYKYNTPLSESIGEADDDNNIFKLYLNDFVFTLGTDETVNNIYVVNLQRLTKTKELYNVELLVLAKISINIPSGNINSFNNRIQDNLNSVYNSALMTFRCDNKKEANLQDYCNLKYPSSNKVDILILESRKYITGGDCLDISYGNIYDKYGRTLTKGAIYLVNDDKTLELNKNLNDYFKIDLENKTICIDASKINYSPLKYKCRYISRESAELGSMGVKAYAHGCYPRMNEEYPIFKDLEDIRDKDWERV